MAVMTGTCVALPDERFSTEEDFMEQLSENLKAAGFLEEDFYVYSMEEMLVNGEQMVAVTAFSYTSDANPQFFVPGSLPPEWE